MNSLKLYYERFFGTKPIKCLSKEFLTRLQEDSWVSNFPGLYGLEVFSLRMIKAYLLKQKVAIFADYDTDAVCASSTLYWAMMEMGFAQDQVTIYAPDRFTESYGLNISAIRKLARENDLIITVDCGINSLEEADFLSQEHCDLVVTDHHQIKEGLPDATTVINPQTTQFLAKKPAKRWHKKQVEHREKLIMSLRNFLDPELYKKFAATVQPQGKEVTESLVGAGVIWFALVYCSYFLQSLLKNKVLQVEKQTAKRLLQFTPKKLEKLLSYVAIATVADCQSVREPLNRSLIQIGLKLLNTRAAYPGLQKLIEKTGLLEKQQQGYKINSQDLGFIISPILNAAGRIAHANSAIAAMTSWKIGESGKLVDNLIQLNTQRKNMVSQALTEIDPIITTSEAGKATVLVGAWSKGIVGLLASRVQSKTNAVSFVVSRDEQSEVWAGSARAPEGYDLVSLLKSCENFLESYGGHAQAAGLKIKSHNIDDFTHHITQLVNKVQPTKSVLNVLPPEVLSNLPETLRVYGQIPNILSVSQEECTPDWLSKIWMLDPFGQDFPLPLLLLQIKDYQAKKFGNSMEHTKIHTTQGVVIISFNTPLNHQEQLSQGKACWILAKPSISVFRSQISHELIIDTFLSLV